MKLSGGDNDDDDSVVRFLPNFSSLFLAIAF